jgi:hypothetical protein
MLSIHGFFFLHPFYQVLRWISFSIVNLLSQSVFCRHVPTYSRKAGYPYQTFPVTQLSTNFLMVLVFGFLVHLFLESASSVLSESVEMVVGLLVCVVPSSAIIIAYCSALYMVD